MEWNGMESGDEVKNDRGTMDMMDMMTTMIMMMDGHYDTIMEDGMMRFSYLLLLFRSYFSVIVVFYSTISFVCLLLVW